MTAPDPAPGPATEEPQELSAEARAVIARARRSFAFSMGLLMLGFIAIAFALVFRAARDEGPELLSLQSVAIPAAAAVVSVAPGDGMLAVTYTLEGETRTRLFDAETGEIVGEIGISAE